MNNLFYHFLSAAVWGGSVLAAAESTPDLGNIMFVGDSITHGFGTPSYRWPLHKIFVDNGVQFVAVGVTQGNQNPRFCVQPGTPYAGVPFNNRHSAMSSERAYEIAGRINQSGRLGNSNMFDWLGLDSEYSGEFKLDMPDQTPDTVVMMIGTNDTFGDYGNKGGIGAGTNMQQAQAALIGTADAAGTWSGTGDLDVIADALRRVNPAVRIVILTIPTWHDARHNNNTAADFAALHAYNKALTQWAAAKKIEVVDVNRVLVNPAREDKPGVAEVQFFHNRDRLHPTVQGDLLIAAEVAKALGCPGRTVGLPRKSATEFAPMRFRGGVFKSTNAMPLPERGAATFTGALRCRVGDGPAQGWNPEPALRVTLGNGENTGVLHVTESSILWGEKKDKVLYTADMSALAEEIRVAYVAGNAEEGRTPGFYVWLGQDLIGEALPGMDSAANGHVPGLILAPLNGIPVELPAASVSAGAYAPAL